MAQDVSSHRLWMLYDGIHMAYDGFIWLKMWPTSASDAVRWHASGVCMARMMAYIWGMLCSYGLGYESRESKNIEKMGRFAYSLQEVLSYFILSPRCLHDGSKVAYGGREGAGHPPGWS